MAPHGLHAVLVLGPLHLKSSIARMERLQLSYVGVVPDKGTLREPVFRRFAD
jgi:hypothetical protein